MTTRTDEEMEPHGVVGLMALAFLFGDPFVFLMLHASRCACEWKSRIVEYMVGPEQCVERVVCRSLLRARWP